MAYFNQVFWNSLEGRFFTQSIHPHLSLGDHAELLIPFLLPFYGLFQDPRTLLVLQAAALSIAAAPLYLLTKHRLGDRSKVPLLVALAYLASPLVHNIALFEFHILPFAIPFLFAALLAYDRGRKGEFMVWATLAMLAREDVTMVVAAIGLLAWIERRSRFWRFVPIVFGAAWFLAAMRLIGHFAPEGGYKFLVYYSWLGGSFGEILLNAIKHPIKVFVHIDTLPNLEMILGFGMPLLFLPYFRPRRLLLAIGPLAQILLGAPGGGSLILETHYASLFLPAIFAAAIDGVAALPGVAKRTRLDKKVLTAIFAVGAAYGAIALGPLPSVAVRMFAPGADIVRANAAREALGKIPASASVIAGYSLLPNLSSRERLHSLHYAFLGVTQYGGSSYKTPDSRVVAFDSEDLLTYRTQFLNTGWTRPYYGGGYDRLASRLGAPMFSRDAFTIYDSPVPSVPGTKGTGERAQTSPAPAGGRFLNDRITLESWPEVGRDTLLLNLRWKLYGLPPDVEPAMRLTVKNGKNKAVLTRDYGFANAPVSIKKAADGPILSRLEVPIADLPAGRYWAEIELAREDAFVTVSGIRSVERVVTGRESWGGARVAEFVR
ncbi:DUF2079 domain-containing protein [Candidatus Uhrbacteria bacterium]|nr:DUF2079 domain-containing protein [Candidatus Uhrbacteria bacterium]